MGCSQQKCGFEHLADQIMRDLPFILQQDLVSIQAHQVEAAVACMHACEAAHIKAWTDGNTSLWSLVVHQLQLVGRQADCDLNRFACAEASDDLEGQRLLLNVGAYCVLDHLVSSDCDLVISARRCRHNLHVERRTDEYFRERVHALARGSCH